MLRLSISEMACGLLQAWTGEQNQGDGIVEMLTRLPNAKWSFTTLGAQGSVLVERVTEPPEGIPSLLFTNNKAFAAEVCRSCTCVHAIAGRKLQW